MTKAISSGLWGKKSFKIKKSGKETMDRLLPQGFVECNVGSPELLK